jgi:hypothetical protein
MTADERRSNKGPIKKNTREHNDNSEFSRAAESREVIEITFIHGKNLNDDLAHAPPNWKRAA